VSLAYEQRPVIAVGREDEVRSGWADVGATIAADARRGDRCVVAVDCYPGVHVGEVRDALAAALAAATIINAEDALRPAGDLSSALTPYLGDDPVFGRMSAFGLDWFFDPDRVASLRARVGRLEHGIALVIGTGALVVAPDADLLIYADLTRWEIQRRSANARSAISAPTTPGRRQPSSSSAVTSSTGEPPTAGRTRCSTASTGTSTRTRPDRLSSSRARHTGGRSKSRPDGRSGWCRSSIPDRGRRVDAPQLRTPGRGAELRLVLRLRSGGEQPAVRLRLAHHQFAGAPRRPPSPLDLLGRKVFETFGAEFPIRFDLLDTWEGGNLSLQVHPLRDYIRKRFGMNYTQDESYYVLDAKAGAQVYLGFKDGIDATRFTNELEAAQSGGPLFLPAHHVTAWPSVKHAHFSIPAGTIHCSGRDNVVLEISATPYIFTFKLWDWDASTLTESRVRSI
jgi:hypothetical protein